MYQLRGNEYKIIRTIKLSQHYFDKNVINYDVDREEDIKGYIADSELLRIVEQLESSDSDQTEKPKHKYLKGVISVKVGENIADTLYKKIEDNGQKLILKHCKKELNADGTYTWNDVGVEEIFVRMVVNSSHIRQSKAMFVREDLYDKVHKVLTGGMDEYADMNGYPMYAKGGAKWSAYYGLACTDSIAVKGIPNIIVVADCEKEVEDTFDLVTQHKTIDEEWTEADGLKNKYKKTYTVDRGVKRPKKILPFDGAGLVSVECATQWCKDMGITGYIPSAWQFRAIPGVKGNVYTFDIMGFGADHGYIITDILGNEHDIRKEKIDLILTKSQVKFLDMYGGDISLWRKKFEVPVVFDDGTSYQRTFNICDYAENPLELDKQTRSAYQHLQTVMFTEEERKSYIQKTVDKVKEVSTDMEKFLQYRGCYTFDEEDTYIPPYYRVAAKLGKKKKAVLFADSYFKEKVTEDIKGLKKRALAGKELIDGNYQFLVPDLYGLAQFCFGEREQNKIGILSPYEVYSNWWLNYYGKVPTELAVVRNPHIFMEARVVNLVTEATEDMEESEQSRREEIFKWFKYQTTGIITDSYSTIALALGTADFDGDHVQTTNSKEYISAIKRAIKNGNGYTVDWKCDGEEEKPKSVDVTNIKDLMMYDRLGYCNNIGTVIDKVTLLWGIEQTDDNTDILMKYIAIADIIGQLTIDSAKTGEFEKFYHDISEYYKELGAKTPYFKRFLGKYSKKVAKEIRALKNVEFYFSDDEKFDKILQNQLEFSDDNTNMNLICHDLEKAFAEIEQSVEDMPLDLGKFLGMFLTDNVNTHSDLYKKIKAKMIELSERNKLIFYKSIEDESSDRNNQYKWFYHYARKTLLNECKLSAEKSMEKVLNIIIYLCYCDKDVAGNNAKAIMWNAFGEEMLKRATRTKIKEIEISDTVSAPVTTKSKKTKASKAQVQINPTYQIDGSKICFTQDIWKQIVSVTKSYNSSKSMVKAVPVEETKCLRRLAIALTLLCMESVTEDKDGNPKYNAVVIYPAANGKLNKTTLAKMCQFTENQRKDIDKYIKKLATDGFIEIGKGKMANIRIKVPYIKETFFGADLIPNDVKKSQDLYGILKCLYRAKRL